MIFLTIVFVSRSTTEMLLESAFCTYITPANESAVKLPVEPKALIAGNKELVCRKVEPLTISTATTTTAATIINMRPIASINRGLFLLFIWSYILFTF